MRSHRPPALADTPRASPTSVSTLLLIILAVFGSASAGHAAGQEGPAADVGYLQGDASAPVLVIELLDFSCPACALFAEETYPAIRDLYVRSGQVQWQAIPFVLGSFRNSGEAARAAACADEQATFWPMHDLLFERRSSWVQARDPENALLEFARELGLDEDRFHRCYRSEAARERIEEQSRAARRLRVRGTPTFVIGGKLVAGAIDMAEFSRRIEAQLGR